MNQSIRLLHLEDDPRDAELIRRKLKAEGLSCDIMWVNDRKAFESALARESFDLVLSDYDLKLPDFDGMSALQQVRDKQPDVPVIVISGTLGEEAAVECLRAGANDYVLKQRLPRFAPAVLRAISEARERVAHRRAEQELEETRSRLDSIVSSLSDVVWSYSLRDKRLLYVSAAVAEVYGRPAAAFHENPGIWRDTVHPDDRVHVKVEREAGLAAKRFESIYRVVLPDGGTRWIQDRVRVIRDENGRPVQLDGLARDITERKVQQDKIEHLSRVHAVLSGINALIVRVRDREELFREACRIAVEAGGFRMAWLGVVDREAMRVKPVAWHGTGSDYIEMMPVEIGDLQTAMRGLAARAVMERKAMIVDDMTQDPRITLGKEARERGFQSLVMLPLVVAQEAVGVLALYAGEVGFFNAQELKLLHELAGDIAFALDHIEKTNRLDYLAFYDSLTGLANRTLFLDRLNQYVHAAGSAGDKIALVLADVERFRTVNDSLGRQAGDALLKQLAERLARGAGNGELARIGVDVFAIVLQGVKGKSEVTHRIERTWHDCFSESMRLGDSEIRISAKAGVAFFPNDGADAETLLRNADAALRRAKGTGERHVFHSPEMTEKSGEKLTLESKLRQALEKEEFVLHYQPKVELETRRIVGVEALIRWQSPELGLVPPMKFIPLMEETGMILDVGAWALRRAAMDHRRWVEQRLQPPRVAVNVSAIQLRQRDFVRAVEQAIMEGVAPTGIDLEITESLIMEDVQASIEKLKAVRGLGVGIAIDDFGTGYSSLGYLAKLPAQTLKIDRSFIITMLNDPDTMTLVQTMISLAHSLRLTVVAEGVDAEEQAKMLGLLRCDEMQGYLFSRPVPFDQMTALLTQGAKG